MKFLFIIGSLVCCNLVSSQTYVTSNKDGTPDNHVIYDTTTVIQPYAVSSKRFTGIGKNLEVVCSPVKAVIDQSLEPTRVSSQKLFFKKEN